MIQQDYALVCVSVGYGFLSLLHTDKGGPVVVVLVAHNVAFVLFSPGGRAAGLGRDHQGHLTRAGKTHGTGDIVVSVAL